MEQDAKPNTVLYCNCMEEIRRRLSLVQSVLAGSTTGHNDFDIEVIFLQFRKSLELIAFGSLTANQTAYSAAYANFAEHWRAKDMLAAMEKLNQDFYPLPLQLPITLENGIKHCELVQDGFLTRDEFIFLYDKSSEILHARNPFTTRDSVIQIRRSVAEWVARIQKLLAFHRVSLIDGTVWIVEISNDGPVRLHSAAPND